ncbi:hypothetical protein [Nocardia wallacei]|uniref:hypothetical protein n=1 Tax=Nocardia wallacei TaxID=480035 RepID=UPI0024545C9A|nr:hypothetical protein [Nocardia wallacei]
MPDTFDTTTAATADTDLPPLTAAIRKTWRDSTGRLPATDAVPHTAAMRALFDAIHALELRVIDLEQ